MKKRMALNYLIIILAVTAVLLAISFLSYRIALHQFNSNAVEKGNSSMDLTDKSIVPYTDYEKVQIIQDNTEQITQTTTTEENTVEAVGVNDIIISSKTQIIMQTYDLSTKSMEENTINTPEYLIGLTREGVMDYINEYMADLKISEYEKGIISFELISFSNKMVVLRKSYNIDKVNYKYYMAVIDGMITVYYSDLITVFEYTDIEVYNLSEEDQAELMGGKYIKDIEELYGILENYSS